MSTSSDTKSRCSSLLGLSRLNLKPINSNLQHPGSGEFGPGFSFGLAKSVSGFYLVLGDFEEFFQGRILPL